MKHFNLYLALIMVVCMVTVSFANIVDDAVAAVESGDLEKGHYLLLKAAGDGSARAQDELGAYYQFYENNYEEAFKWYRKSAEQGFADAQYNVGSSYDFGQGVERNPQEATKWYRLAVAQNHSWAQYNLAISYLNGSGVPKNQQKAARLMEKAAKQGHAGAQNNLASLYYQGVGVEKSVERSIAWLIVSSLNGSDEASRNLERFSNYYDSETIEKGKQIADEILQTVGH